MAQRIYKQATIFNARIVGMRNLWEPSREYMGKPTEKPNYLASIVTAKTRANWFEEPVLADLTRACQELYGAALSHIPFPQVIWPVKDGDLNEPGRAQAEWRKGQWLLTGSSTSPITVTIVQGGVPVPLLNRLKVKPGDFVGVSVALAVKVNDPRGVKCYLNNVMFMGEGEEIAVGGSVSAVEMMAKARDQGLNVTGFGGSGAPQQGFGQGFAPPMDNPATIAAPATAPHTAFPSNGGQTGFAPSPVAPPAQQGFAAPGGFNAPTGFPSRQ